MVIPFDAILRYTFSVSILRQFPLQISHTQHIFTHIQQPKSQKIDFWLGTLEYLSEPRREEESEFSEQ